MAEGFEPYHVPQQSRRDKMRVINHQPACGDNLQIFPPFYDPPLDFNLHRQNYATDAVKGEAINPMGFIANHIYAAPLLPNPIQDINATTPYVYVPPHCYRGLLDQPFHRNEAAAAAAAAVSKPTPQTVAAASGGQSLSLSLSSHYNILPLELNLPRYDSPIFSSTKASEGYIYSGGSAPAVPGQFTGYASVLRGSRFLKSAQQLLEELCDVGRGIYGERNGVDSSELDPSSLESLSGSEIVDGDQTRKKSRLLSMLDEVYKRYKQYYQQIAAVAAFESVAGLSNAAPFATLALKAMSKHFRCLKNAITDQLQFTSKSHHSERDETPKLESLGRGSYSQRPFHAGFVDQPIWRPQRGLPERAVTVLRAWLFEHFLHPYPTDTDKIMLANQAGLSRNQVSNWFINARVRLWKPMVEEIHMLETRQGQQKPSQREEQKQPPNSVNNHLPAVESENASTSVERVGDFPLKRSREDPTEAMPYGHMGVGLSNVGSSGGVSLTLGLHQNCVGLPDSSYPMNAARRFGLESNGEGYVVSGFAAQNREFGRDVIDGQIMHDFVG